MELNGRYYFVGEERLWLRPQQFNKVIPKVLAICMANSKFFEDREPMDGFRLLVNSMRHAQNKIANTVADMEVKVDNLVKYIFATEGEMDLPELSRTDGLTDDYRAAEEKALRTDIELMWKEIAKKPDLKNSEKVLIMWTNLSKFTSDLDVSTEPIRDLLEKSAEIKARIRFLVPQLAPELTKMDEIARDAATMEACYRAFELTDSLESMLAVVARDTVEQQPPTRWERFKGWFKSKPKETKDEQ